MKSSSGPKRRETDQLTCLLPHSPERKIEARCLIRGQRGRGHRDRLCHLFRGGTCQVSDELLGVKSSD